MKNMFDLTGKNAVVIGGGGGIGQAIAKGLSFYGAKVVITGRNLETLEKAADEIKKEIGKEIICISADASDEKSVILLKEKAIKALGQVDILVNSQGYNKKYPINEMPIDVWDDMFAINVKSIMLTCREFAKEMISRGYGRIINVTSIRGIRAVNGGLGNTAYSTTKGAVDMLIKSLASEWAKTGVTVNGIGPVITETPMMIPIFEAQPEFKPNLLRNIPMGRIGVVEDNIGPAVFLASDAAAFVTGSIIYPDGGSASIV